MLVFWVVTVFTFLPGYFSAPMDVPPFGNHVHEAMDKAEPEVTTLPETNTSSGDCQYQAASISEGEGQSYSTLANKEDGNCESTTEDDGQYRPQSFMDDEKFDDGSFRPSDYTTMKTVEEGNEDLMAVFVKNMTPNNGTYTNESSLENVTMTRILIKNKIEDSKSVKANTLIALQLYKTDYGIENYDENADNGADDAVRRFDDFEHEKSDDGSYKPDAYPIEDYDEKANNGTYRTSSDDWRSRRDFDVFEKEEVQLAPVVFRVGSKKETPRNTTTGVVTAETNIG